MKTETNNFFDFLTKINSKNELELYCDNIQMNYDNLTDYIKEKYEDAKVLIEEKNNNIKKLNEKLQSLIKDTNNMETEYIKKQREIGAFLEYRKTFIGKMKYFFKSNNISKKIKNEVEKERFGLELKQTNEESDIIDIKPLNTYMNDKELYTIEDLVVIFGLLENANKKEQDLFLDIKAMELKYENIKRKLKNSESYIAEIDMHKKSIFDFWKYTRKDEILTLESGEEQSTENNNIVKAFDFESDFEMLGASIDKLQKKKLSKEEFDSIFVANSKIINVLNELKKGNINDKLIKEAFSNLKDEFTKNRLTINEESFDIFGNITGDARKPKYIGSRSHRENEKSIYKILEINKKIDEFDFTEKLQSILNYIEGAFPKIKSEYNMPLYKLLPIANEIDNEALMVMDINAQNELKNYEEVGEGALNLIKINFKENMPLLFYSNIVFFDNTNKTLPEGMNLSSRVLIDCSRFEFKLINQTKFRTNNYFRESGNLILPKSKDIFVYEYDVKMK